MTSPADSLPSGGVELWLLRHGATEWSINGRHTGRTDLPLLAEGEAEARALQPFLQGISFVAIATSPLQRARRTCELAGLSATAEVWQDLSEWDYGAFEGRTTPDICQGQADWTIWSHGCPDGEDGDAVQTRCQRVVDRALALASQSAQVSPTQGEGPYRIALFAHGHILRSLAGTWLGLGARGGRLLTLGTCGIGVLGFERTQRSLLRWNIRVS